MKLSCAVATVTACAALLWTAALAQPKGGEGGGEGAGEDADGVDEVDYEIWDLMDGAVKIFGPGFTWYENFGLSESSTPADLKRSFYKLSLQYHPDRNPTEEAAEKYRILAGMNKILKDKKLREKYDYWVTNGIPYWRGKVRRFIKSESLSMVQSVVVVLLVAATIQYIAMVVHAAQVRSGLRLLKQQRESVTAKKKDKNRLQATQTGGIFDDANMKRAAVHLVLNVGVPPEAINDKKEWDRVMAERFDGADVGVVWPKPWHTFVFTLPVQLVAKFADRKPSADKSE